METIEGALRTGGLALLGEGFQLDSSLNWVFGETVEGEVDVVVPLWSRGGHIVFAQPGAVFWTGFEEEERIDGNFGVVYRTMMADDVIGGVSLFYDHDFQIGHSRLGVGIDAQRRGFYGAFNYYHPLSDTEDGREGYVEDALQGMDIRLAVESDVTRFGGNVGYWKFQGDEDEDVREDWKLSFGIDAGLRIIPGVFLEGSLQRHDKDASLGQRASVGLAFKFSLPDFKGKSYGNGGGASSLYKIVEREKRILYEERLGIPPVNLSATEARVVEPEETGGSKTVTVEATLGKPLDADVMLNIMIADTSTATLGTDFTYGHKVYEPGEQTAPSGDAEPCPEDVAMACEVMIPAGVTRFDIEANIAMTAEREVREFIDFQIEVPEEYAGLLRGGVVERVAIEAHGNTVAFASDAPTTLAENNETTGIDVPVNIDLPSPAPITLNVALSGTATEGTDYRISTRSLVIPANASSASLTLRGIDNTMSGGSKQIVLTLSGNLPEGWDFGPVTDPVNPPETITHTVNLRDDDLSVGFVRGSDTIDEPASDTPHTVDIEITQAPTADVTLQITRATASTAASTGSNIDVTFSPSTVTFTSTDFTPKTVTLDVKADTIAEGAEFIELELGDSGNTLTGGGNAFSFGRQTYRLNINGSDNTVGFASDATATLDESGGTASVEVSTTNAASVPITLNVSATGDSTATEGTDYRNLPASVTISAGQTSGTITLTGIEDQVIEADETIVLMLSAGTLPTGWTLGTAVMHTVTISDDPPANISFSSGVAGGIDEGRFGSSTANINLVITPASTSDITIPLTFTGDHDPISDAVTVSGGTATLTGTPSANNVMINVPANLGTVTLAVVAGQDCDRDTEDVSFSLGTLPAGYVAGLHSSWTITIHDAGARGC